MGNSLVAGRVELREVRDTDRVEPLPGTCDG